MLIFGRITGKLIAGFERYLFTGLPPNFIKIIGVIEDEISNGHPKW